MTAHPRGAAQPGKRTAQQPSASSKLKRHDGNRTGQVQQNPMVQPPAHAQRQNNLNKKGAARIGQTQNNNKGQMNAGTHRHANTGAAAENKGAANQPGRIPGNAAQGATPQNAGRSIGGNKQNAQVKSHGRINLSQQQASRVHETLLRRGREAHRNVNFSVDVGASVPQRAYVYLRPLPPSVVEISPQFRRDEYVVVHDQIVIVEPRTKRIVEVIGPASGEGPAITGRSVGEGASVLSLTDQQREIIRRDILRRHPRTERIHASVGQPVSGRAVIEPVPQIVVAQVPKVRSYDYIVTSENRILLVNPQTREVVATVD